MVAACWGRSSLIELILSKDQDGFGKTCCVLGPLYLGCVLFLNALLFYVWSKVYELERASRT